MSEHRLAGNNVRLGHPEAKGYNHAESDDAEDDDFFDNFLLANFLISRHDSSEVFFFVHGGII